MKSVPRIFINEKLEVGKQIPVSKEILHYLQKVMRTNKCLVFNNGTEFNAEIINYQLSIINSTNKADPSNNLTFCFAPIRRLDDMLNMATQMGVVRLQPVITERTVAHHINWGRIQKIIIEAAEQSGRNSIPELMVPQKFDEFLKGKRQKAEGKSLVFADERFAHCDKHVSALCLLPSALLIGPEGGFSDSEFAALDAAGAIGISLGPTILRAETAAVAALAKILL